MKRQIVWMLVLALVVLQGCAHKEVEKRLDEQLALEPEVHNRAELSAESAKAIAAAPGLTEDQKKKLSVLRETTNQQTDKMFADSLKLRAVLIKNLVSSNYSDEEVGLIKKRIKKLEESRLTVLFTAVDQANAILGHKAKEHQAFIREFLYEPHTTR